MAPLYSGCPQSKGYIYSESGVSLCWPPWTVAAFLCLSEMCFVPLEPRRTP